MRPALLLVLLAAGCAAEPVALSDTQPGVPPPAAGAALGTATGGLLGAQFGAGAGQFALIGGLGVVGGLIGLAAGRGLERTDPAVMARAAQLALETAPTGTAVAWTNTETGTQGSFTPTRDWTGKSGEPCRDFRQTLTVEDNTAEGEGAACRRPDGRWRIVG
jgi:surface antigen